jgi:hypothetical protein
MADLHPRHRRNSWAHLCPSSLDQADDRSRYFEPRRRRRGSIRIKSLREGYETPPIVDTLDFQHHLTGKLSLPQAKQTLRSLVSIHKTTVCNSSTKTSSTSTFSLGNMRAGIRGSIGGPVSGMVSRPSLAEDVRAGSDARTQHMNTLMPGTDPYDKPLASGSGVSLSINLAEPALFLQGFEQNDVTSGNTAMLRGTLHLRVSKAAKIKAVTLKFKGRATTKWPEGEIAANR